MEFTTGIWEFTTGFDGIYNEICRNLQRDLMQFGNLQRDFKEFARGDAHLARQPPMFQRFG